MRITILQGAFFPIPPVLGGAVEKRWYAVSRIFAEMGHAVTHVSRRYESLPEAETRADVQHIRVPGYDTPASGLALKWCDLRYTLAAMRVLPEADILVTNTFWAPLLAPKPAGKVYVDVARMPKGQMRLYGRAARLRANSTAVANAIIKEHPAAQERVQMIPNPLPFEATQPVDFANKQKRLLYVGRVHPEKGIRLLLEAFTSLSEGVLAEWELDIVGPGETARGGGGSAYIEQLQRDFPDERIHWVGPVFGEDELAEYYQRAKLFIYPSIAEQGETFGLAPLESMAWGCIPVVSDLDCFKDFIKDGSNGFIFNHRTENPGAKLAEAISKAMAAKANIAEVATKVRETHSTRSIAKQFVEDFERLLQ